MAGETTAIQPINPAGLRPPGGHYSHGTVANGFVFVSGQLPITPEGEKLVDAPFEEQALQVLANVAAVLQAAGSSIGQLVQVRVYLDDIENWPAFNTLYTQWAGDARPARAIVPTGRLHFGVKVEVEATALAP
ncbi:RidA family protein [Xylophilus sp. GW821-FHT01B05]